VPGETERNVERMAAVEQPDFGLLSLLFGKPKTRKSS
jgi:hypothetical protein